MQPRAISRGGGRAASLVVSPVGGEEGDVGTGGEGGEEFRDGGGEAGKDEVGADVGEGLEDEAAEGYARVGQGEGGGCEAEGASVEDVEVEGAGGIFRAASGAAEGLFEDGEEVEQGGRGGGSGDFHDGVEEGERAGRATDGGGFVEGGDQRGSGVFVQGGEEAAAREEEVGAVAEVGAEGDADAHGGRISPRGAGSKFHRGVCGVRCRVVGRGLVRLIVTVSAVLLAVLCVAGAQEDEDVSPYREMKTLAQVVELVRGDYVDEGRTEYQELVYSALRGMLTDLDPHSDFMEPEDFTEMQEDTKSEFGGLGVVVSVKEDRLVVVAPMEGTPGFRAGLLPGDVLLEIGGESAEKMSLRDAVSKLRGAPGTKVSLVVGREGEKAPLKFELEREVIKVPSVRGARMVEGEGRPKIGYVRVTQFSEPTGREFARALEDLEEQGMEALVLDLRFNPGGLLGSAVDVAGEFLPGGALVCYTEGRSPTAARRYNVPVKGRKPRTYPVAVLVNGSSASGAEIVAGALKDSGRALLIGETTFGKGSVQSVMSLKDGSAVRLTTAKYFTPGKQLIHGKGVTPHIVAAMSGKEEGRLLTQRRLEDLPPGGDVEAQVPVEDFPLQRAVDALRGVLLHAKTEGAAAAPSGGG